MAKLYISLIVAGLLFGFVCLSFSAETVVFKGKVIDAEGRPVKGAEVFLYDNNNIRRPADFISSKTDNEGRFNMAVPPGKYLAVSRLRSSEKYGPLLPVDKHSGEPVEIELELGKEIAYEFKVSNLKEAAEMMRKNREDFFKLSGRVLDKDSAPVKDIYAFAYTGLEPSEVPDYLSAWTDDSGNYTIFLPAGEYSVGYASAFPLDRVNIYKKITVTGDNINLDIIIDLNKADKEAGAGEKK
ncbi:MAG: carboxypeptidase regulatory-like domain-containing protein [Nitrospirae bacterium]|nr:carboxypeptidase regulatory-like domain-containing protein [Nitrospirota bacterium]